MLKMIELFSGIGSQSAAMERLARDFNFDFEVIGTAELDRDAILSYSNVHCNPSIDKENIKTSDAVKMAAHLTQKNIGYDFKKDKPFDWLKLINKNGQASEELIRHYQATKSSKNYGDISKINKLDYADFWTYSFPCQDLSIAGKQRGITKDSRSGLLYQVERLLEIAKQNDEMPKYLMLENVKNLMGSKFKSDFMRWINRLDDLGYNTYWEILNAKNYGIPQNRERVFAISIRKDIDNGFTFPDGFDNGVRLKDILEDHVDEKYYISNEKVDKLLLNIKERTTGILYEQATRYEQRDVSVALCARDYKGFGNQGMSCVVETNDIKRLGNIYGEDKGTGFAGNVWDENYLSPTLTTMQGGNRQPCIMIPQATSDGYIECNIPGIFDMTYPDSKTRRGRVQDNGDTCPTLTASSQELMTIEKSYKIRKLTPLECWRLMGFDDVDFYKAQASGVSNSQLYKQAGNSIVVDVLYYIFKNLFIETEKKNEDDIQFANQLSIF